MKVPISDIKPPRGKLRNPSAVAVYAQRLRAGEQAPPITLWKLKTGLFKFYIEDGDHRYLAAQSIGAQFIAARRFVIASSRNKNRSHRNSRTLHTNQLPTVAIVKAALQTQRRRNAPGEVGDIACAVALERLLSVLNGCDEATRPRSALDCMFDSIFHGPVPLLTGKRTNFIEPNERVLYPSQVKIVECPRQRCTTHPPRRTCDARNGDHEVSRFRERDIRRAMRAVEKAGKQAASVEIDVDGKIIIVIVGTPGDGNKETELDRWIEKHHAHDA